MSCRLLAEQKVAYAIRLCSEWPDASSPEPCLSSQSRLHATLFGRALRQDNRTPQLTRRESVEGLVHVIESIPSDEKAI